MPEATDPAELALRKTLRLERYAEILAHVLHFGPDRAGEVVARFGLTLERWRAVDAAWTSELALGMKRQQNGQALRFSATFNQRRRRLAAEQPAVGAVGDAMTFAGPGAVQATPATGAEPSGLPSFMVAPASPAAPVAAPPAPRIAVPLGTMFAPGTPATAEGVLPFVEGSASAALEAALAHAHAVQGPKPPPPSSLQATILSNEELASIARALPFVSSAGPGVAPPPPGATAASPPAATAASAPSDTLALSLEQYASLHVELELYPGKIDATLQRYGLGAEQYATIDAGWRGRMGKDPALVEAWEDARSAYRAWLTQKAH